MAGLPNHAMLSLAIAAMVAVTLSPSIAADTYGCEANPTGNPIGGGESYSDILTGGDRAARTADQLLAALGNAQAGDVIYVPDGCEIDLTGHTHIPIPAGVTLAGSRGRDGSQGARIFTAHRDTYPLLQTGGENVRITGLRFEGPYGGRERTADLAAFLVAAHYGCEVDNCEIYNFNYAGVCGRLGASKLMVHHNFIHHSQYAGLGYGVSLDQCDAYVIANKFDWCRHHVAATGTPGCAYEAAYNLILPNANGHYFDMHGGRDRGDGTDIAGDWMDIHHNTFQGTQAAVVIRGVPSQEADVHHNWFVKPAAQSVRTSSNTRVHDNVYGPEKVLEE